MRCLILFLWPVFLTSPWVNAAEKVTRSYYSEKTQEGPLVKVSQQQTKVESLLQIGDNLCNKEFFKEFPKESLFFFFPQKKQELKLLLNQFVGSSTKGLGCQVNENVNCKKLVYRGDHFSCSLAYQSPGKGSINTVKLNFKGEILFDKALLKAQNLEEKELCKTFLQTPQIYQKELIKLKKTAGMNYFDLNQKLGEIYFVYMGCGARFRKSQDGLCEVAITDMGEPLVLMSSCAEAFISKEGVTCSKKGEKEVLLPYQFCLGKHIAVQNYNQDPKNEKPHISGIRNNPLSLFPAGAVGSPTKSKN